MTTQLSLRPQVVDVDLAHFARDLRSMQFAAVPHGGVEGIYDLKVIPRGADVFGSGGTPGMSVDVYTHQLPAGAWIRGQVAPSLEGVYRIPVIDTLITEAVAANTTGANRIDSVVLEVNGSNYPQTRVIQGTTTAPALSGNMIELARLTLPNNFTTVTSGMIEDRRVFTPWNMLEAAPTSDVRLVQNAATTICQVTVPLEKSQRVMVGAAARVMADVSSTVIGWVALQLVIDGTPEPFAAGPVEVAPGSAGDSGVNEATGRRGYLTIPTHAVNLPAGNRSILLQGIRDGNGIIDATGLTVTMGGRSWNPTRLWVNY